MPVSSFAGIREKIRRSIRDTQGLLWDDTALDSIINEAQREYALYSGSLSGVTDIRAGHSGISFVPDDFIEPVKFIGTDNFERPVYSWRYLDSCYPDFRKIKGTELEGIVFDFDGFSKIRLFPVLPVGEYAGKLYYKRLPKPDKLETKNIDALEMYSLFHVFLLDGDPGAGMFYKKFIESINAESSVQRGLKSRSRIRNGRFF